MKEINCLIVEDEPLAARVMADYVRLMPELRLAGICEDVPSAVRKISAEKIDLILLDINLPKINGLDLVKTLGHKCHVILTTAYHEYAVTGYELDVVDYLLKPIAYERFTKAIGKVLELEKLTSGKPADTGSDHIFIKNDGKMIRVPFGEILFVEAVQNYVLIHMADRKLLTYSSLKKISELLPAERFMKVQKSYIVALGKITALQGGDIYIGKTTIAISRKLKEEIRTRILSK